MLSTHGPHANQTSSRQSILDGMLAAARACDFLASHAHTETDPHRPRCRTTLIPYEEYTPRNLWSKVAAPDPRFWAATGGYNVPMNLTWVNGTMYTVCPALPGCTGPFCATSLPGACCSRRELLVPITCRGDIGLQAGHKRPQKEIFWMLHVYAFAVAYTELATLCGKIRLYSRGPSFSYALLPTTFEHTPSATSPELRVSWSAEGERRPDRERDGVDRHGTCGNGHQAQRRRRRQQHRPRRGHRRRGGRRSSDRRCAHECLPPRPCLHVGTTRILLATSSLVAVASSSAELIRRRLICCAILLPLRLRFILWETP